MAFVNEASVLVNQAIDGAVAAAGNLTRLEGTRVVIRSPWNKDKVALISGGGSGHEPAHAGFVGSGMLTAAVCGDVFASPPVGEIVAAIRAVTGAAGALVIVKNYTGDRVNFGIAIEECKRAFGLNVEMVICGDDVAIPKSNKSAGRRGLAGTLFVHKVAGALAEGGASLSKVVSAAQAVASSVGTMSVSSSPCVVPGRTPSFTLPDGKVELGLGIHGEAGFNQIGMQPVDTIVATMVEMIVSADADRNYLPVASGEKVALMVNNLGGTSNIEMSVVTRAALAECKLRGIKVVRCFAGTLMTALQMSGFSLTLLRASTVEVAVEPLLDYSVGVAAWPACTPGIDVSSAPTATPRIAEASVAFPARLPSTVIAALKAVAVALKASEPMLTELDQKVGDGDLGLSLKTGAGVIETLLATVAAAGPGQDESNLGQALAALGEHLGAQMGGSSGAFYNLALRVGSATVANAAVPGSAASWAAALTAGTKAIMKYGGACAGSRTMLDALIPASEAAEAAVASGGSASASIAAAVAAADAGAKATAVMHASAGRSSYIDPTVIKGYEDPGARAVAIWLAAVASVVPASSSGGGGGADAATGAPTQASPSPAAVAAAAPASASPVAQVRPGSAQPAWWG